VSRCPRNLQLVAYQEPVLPWSGVEAKIASCHPGALTPQNIFSPGESSDIVDTALSEIGKYRILSRAARKSHQTPHPVALSFKSRVCGVTPSSDNPFFGWPILAGVRLRTKRCTSDLCSFAGGGNCHSFGDSKKFSLECHNHARNPGFVRSFEANSGRNRTSPSGDRVFPVD
jgi:hypothetical protein